VIHLQNLHAYYLNLPLLFKFLRETDIPVVLTLHDCWAFTGKCAHYTSIKCFKWKTGCFACPAKKDYPHSWFFDKTKKLYEDKKKWFAGIKDLTIIGVSKWAAEQAKMSFLGDRKILTIYNWVDRNVFYPRKDNVLSNYGVDKSVFTIIGVSASWSPGSSRYEDFIKLSTLIGEDMQIVLVGQSKTEKFPRNVKHISFIKDANELAKLYSSADVFVHMSTEDTFGKVVAEAMACGTPAIVYDSTALPELIGEGCGYKIKANDVKEAYEYIQLIQKNGKSAYSGNCIRFVQENFNYQINVKKLITLYESLIKNDDLHS
jgi:glycosyltransferase involved in cell wall biosynthesis